MDIFFQLKKLLGVLISPLPICLTLIIIGAIFLFRGNKTKGLSICISGITLLLLFSMPLFSSLFIRSFEFSYPKLDPTAYTPHYIVVLGCWHHDDESLPLVAKLDHCSLARTVQAVQLANIYPEAIVIFSGYQRQNKTSHPEINAQLAESIGLARTRMQLIAGSWDTEDEVIKLKPIVGERPFVVISSASHFPRLMRLFANHGLSPIASPAEYLSSQHKLGWHSLLPNGRALKQSERALYELLGNLWIRLKSVFSTHNP